MRSATLRSDFFKRSCTRAKCAPTGVHSLHLLDHLSHCRSRWRSASKQDSIRQPLPHPKRMPSARQRRPRRACCRPPSASAPSTFSLGFFISSCAQSIQIHLHHLRCSSVLRIGCTRRNSSFRFRPWDRFGAATMALFLVGAPILLQIYTSTSNKPWRAGNT